MRPQLLIFDLDGTLIDSRADLAAGINFMRGEFGLNPLSVETVGSFVGNGVRKLVERSLQGTAVDLEKALEINCAYYADHLADQTWLYAGVKEGIPALVSAGHRVAVLTNKAGDASRDILKHFEIDRYFSAVIGGGDVPNLKPEPGGIFRCLEIAGMVKSQAWMVGDNYTDLAAAENAGIRSAFVSYGFGDERGLKPDVYFASFSELVGYFV